MCECEFYMCLSVVCVDVSGVCVFVCIVCVWCVEYLWSGSGSVCVISVFVCM
jgi:hypothetical protein